MLIKQLLLQTALFVPLNVVQNLFILTAPRLLLCATPKCRLCSAVIASAAQNFNRRLHTFPPGCLFVFLFFGPFQNAESRQLQVCVFLCVFVDMFPSDVRLRLRAVSATGLQEGGDCWV